MITLRSAASRGHANHGWLDSWHSFSFADYHDPAHLHWGPLRVINEDRVQAGRGFGTHAHRDMEIISYVIEGALGHKDSLGNAASIVPGEVQRMSAGTGVTHSEFNHSQNDTTHFLQIWIMPAQLGIAPSYAQKTFTDDQKRGQLCLVVSPNGAENHDQTHPVTIHQDARIYAGLFDDEEHTELTLAPERLGYVHVVRGNVTINRHVLSAGDALLYENESLIEIAQGRNSEVLVFDLPTMR